jgi:N-acetylglucosaminylphosphatidylinositol deacetylase
MIEMLFWQFSLALSAFLVILKLAYNRLRSKNTFSRFIRFKAIESVLLVIAHPDDEVMFFTPTIRLLAELGCSIQILCLSQGQGNGREGELRGSCKILGVDDFICLNDERLLDGMENKWDLETVRECVLELLKKRVFDLVVTFDNYGVSGHPNHIATCKGVELAISSLPKTIELLELESIRIFRKYSGMVNYIYDFIKVSTGICGGNDIYAIPCPHEVFWIAQEAMGKHSSQLVWYRKIYLLLSRFIFINSFKRINPKKLK